jgi:hypothetical protein
MRWLYHGHLYKGHFACFRCRKAFKRRWPGDYRPPREPDGRPFPCPECGQPMNDRGVDFKAPPQNDQRQWLNVAVLYSFGIRFDWDRDTSEGPGPRPATLSALEDYLAALGYARAEIRARIETVRQSLAQHRSGAEPPGE